jgi:uncharacterized membrane protein
MNRTNIEGTQGTTRTGITAEQDTTDRMVVYSDAVFAVIVTIMVLQLRPPRSHDFSALYVLWPKAASYVVSYVFIAIIWINHHHLTRFIRTSSQRLIWTNFIHLFLVSLLPFTTEWMAQTRLAPIPVVVYAGLFVCADGAYNVFERHILLNTDEIAEHGRRLARRRSLLALALFATATLVAAFQPWIGFSLICAALVLHLKPDVGSMPTPKPRSESFP